MSFQALAADMQPSGRRCPECSWVTFLSSVWTLDDADESWVREPDEEFCPQCDWHEMDGAR